MRAARLWIRARLPARRAQTGWLPRSALAGYAEVHTRLIVDRARLTADAAAQRPRRVPRPVGVGRAGDPDAGRATSTSATASRATPARPTGRSRSAPARGRATLTDWPAGGYVGIHGTDRPELIPGRVSHGCIRLRNADILRLARLLPVGTPLEIR